MQDIQVLEVADGQVRMRVGNVEAVFGASSRRKIALLAAYKEGAQSGGERPYISDALYQRAICQAAKILSGRKRQREAQQKK